MKIFVLFLYNFIIYFFVLDYLFCLFIMYKGLLLFVLLVLVLHLHLYIKFIKGIQMFCL